VTWILAGVLILSIAILLYSSTQLLMHKVIQYGKEFHVVSKIRMTEERALQYRRISILTMISSSVVGMITGYINWIPATEYNYNTVVFRLLSPSIALFLVLLTLGIVITYSFSTALKED
jgi:hypothetical protein